jgi:hypothetical protein
MKTFFVAGFLAAALTGALAIACGPTFPKTVFSYRRHPDFPRSAYLAGDLGVIKPSYARSYLVLAYRYLAGRPLSAVEREQVRDYWKDRESGDWDKTATIWMDRWERTRSRVPGGSAPARSAVGNGRYAFDQIRSSFYMNCAEDAYRTAYRTLVSRGTRFGFASKAVRSWRDAQDAVFADCEGGSKIPAAADASLPQEIRFDREYQIAAAHLYARDYVRAEAGFRAIAATPDSQWHVIAAYLVARTMARAGDPKADAAAEAVLADAKLAPVHGMTRVLLQRMIRKGRDPNYLQSLARDLASGRQQSSFREELWDYTAAYDNLIGYDQWEQLTPAEKQAKIDKTAFSHDDMSDWIFQFQSRDARAEDYALERWRQTRSLPWLVAALQHSEQPQAELMEAAAKIAPGDPGYAMVNFHRLRLRINAGDKVAARDELDQMLLRPMPKSAVNQFRGLRMRTAPDMAGFLGFAVRQPVMLTTDWDEGEVAPTTNPAPNPRLTGQLLLDRDSIKILNERTPLRMLRDAALADEMPSYSRRDLTLAAFTRAVLLDRDQEGLALAAKLSDIGADREHYLARYRESEVGNERRFAGIFYLLHHPEARPYIASGAGRLGRPNTIDPYRDNWWCPVDVEVELNARSSLSETEEPLAKRADADSPAWSAAFLSEADRQEAKAELEKMAATHSGPDYLIEQTLAYAKAHPADPRMPEALHYALRSQRYGCVRAETAKLAETAWRYLWRKYPRSPWTKKSNYWFEPENLPKPNGF